jgi:hypothetical protein
VVLRTQGEFMGKWVLNSGEPVPKNISARHKLDEKRN